MQSYRPPNSGRAPYPDQWPDYTIQHSHQQQQQQQQQQIQLQQQQMGETGGHLLQDNLHPRLSPQPPQSYPHHPHQPQQHSQASYLNPPSHTHSLTHTQQHHSLLPPSHQQHQHQPGQYTNPAQQGPYFYASSVTGDEAAYGLNASQRQMGLQMNRETYNAQHVGGPSGHNSQPPLEAYHQIQPQPQSQPPTTTNANAMQTTTTTDEAPSDQSSRTAVPLPPPPNSFDPSSSNYPLALSLADPSDISVDLDASISELSGLQAQVQVQQDTSGVVSQEGFFNQPGMDGLDLVGEGEEAGGGEGGGGKDEGELLGEEGAGSFTIEGVYEEPPPLKRKRGRPKGVKDHPSLALRRQLPSTDPSAILKRRGRPPKPPGMKAPPKAKPERERKKLGRPRKEGMTPEQLEEGERRKLELREKREEKKREKERVREERERLGLPGVDPEEEERERVKKLKGKEARERHKARVRLAQEAGIAGGERGGGGGLSAEMGSSSMGPTTTTHQQQPNHHAGSLDPPSPPPPPPLHINPPIQSDSQGWF